MAVADLVLVAHLFAAVGSGARSVLQQTNPPIRYRESLFPYSLVSPTFYTEEVCSTNR